MGRVGGKAPRKGKAPRRSGKSPTQIALAYLRGQGWYCEVTERWNPFARVRQDLLGCCDILAASGSGVLLVQVTSADNLAQRRRKIEGLTYPVAGDRCGIADLLGLAHRQGIGLAVLGTKGGAVVRAQQYLGGERWEELNI